MEDEPRNRRRDQGDDEPKQKKRRGEAERARADERQPESRGNMLWITLAAVAAVGAWWLWRVQSEAKHAELPAATATALEFPEATAPKPAPVPAVAPIASAARAAKGPPDEPAVPVPSAAPAASAAVAGAKPAASAPPVAPPSPGSGSFDRVAALAAVGKSASKAAGCRMRGEPAASADVNVTFDPSGAVKEALIRSGPYAGSPTGKCILKKLSETTVAAFHGDPATVVVPVSIH